MRLRARLSRRVSGTVSERHLRRPPIPVVGVAIVPMIVRSYRGDRGVDPNAEAAFDEEAFQI